MVGRSIYYTSSAGNVIDAVGIDSIEYAVKHLGSSIVLVLGHEKCGAVSAVVANQASDIPPLPS